MEYLSIPFHKRFNRKDFSCNKESLDDYIKFQVSQDIKRMLAVCFVLLDDKSESVIAYYTLSNASIPSSLIPMGLKNKFPKSYDYIPVTLLGRLAIDANYHGKGIGGRLLLDALKRCLKVAKSEIGSIAVIVDPIDLEAKNYYLHFGFIEFQDSGKLFLDMNTIKKLNL